MKRGLALSVLVVGTLSLTLQAARPSPPPPQGGQTPAPIVVEVEKLKDNLFILRGTGGGGNTAVFVQTSDTLQKAHDGIRNVDTIVTGHSIAGCDRSKDAGRWRVVRPGR